MIETETKPIFLKDLILNFTVFFILSIVITCISNQIDGTELSKFLKAVSDEHVALKTIYLFGVILNAILLIYVWFKEKKHKWATYIILNLANTFYILCSTSIGVLIGRYLANGELGKYFSYEEFCETGSFFSVIILIFISYTMYRVRYEYNSDDGMDWIKDWIFWMFYIFVLLFMIPIISAIIGIIFSLIFGLAHLK
jgi:membrane protein